MIAVHQAAFDYFGGWPKEILYDNMKQVRLGPGRLNETFADFADHHGFTIKTHRPYRPRTKGKVERSVDYVKDNFLAGRSFDSLDDMNVRVRRWLESEANSRIHGTTGKVPKDLLPQEHLTPVNACPAYRLAQPVRRSVSREAMVHFPRAQQRMLTQPLADFQRRYDRNEAIARAYLSGQYTMAAIAGHFGVHYSE